MPDLERIVQNTPGTVSQQWYEDGVAVDPGTVTVGITRANGTVAVAPGAATAGSGTGARSFNLTTAHTALLDQLTVTWTSTNKGTLVSYVEVAGGFLFALADARALPPLNNTTTYPTAKLKAIRMEVEDAIERELGFALVPRYARETLQPYAAGVLVLSRPHVRTIRDITWSGTAGTPAQLSALTLGPYGTVTSGWWTARSPVTVGYEHGLSTLPPEATRNALILARSWLVSGPVDDRRTSMTTAEGGTERLVIPGEGSSIFGVPAVDAWVRRNSLTVAVA